jgi:hypothetical protein
MGHEGVSSDSHHFTQEYEYGTVGPASDRAIPKQSHNGGASGTVPSMNGMMPLAHLSSGHTASVGTPLPLMSRHPPSRIKCQTGTIVYPRRDAAIQISHDVDILWKVYNSPPNVESSSKTFEFHCLW